VFHSSEGSANPLASCLVSRAQQILGYNLAALQYIQRQHDANKVAEFYEQDAMADEKDIRDKIEAATVKKRKRAALRS